MSQLNIPFIYNPENQTAQQLVDNFVIRQKQFNKIYQDVIETPLNVTPQHYLVEGQRGAGKTTLLLRIAHEIERQKNSSYVVIKLPEEQYGIFTLFHLWQAVVDEMEDMSELSGISDQFDEFAENDENSDGFEVIDRFLNNTNKRLLLLIDNIGDLFNRLSEIELSRMRDIFHTSNLIQLIGASATTLEHTFKHDKPLYEFFKRIKLLGLDAKEAVALIEQLAESYGQSQLIGSIIKNEPQRIEVLRRMTGGVPRTIVLLFEILVDNNNTVFEDLEAILDKVTPLYKHRMDDLSTQQQSIVNAMALHWDGISSKEIVTSLQSSKITTKKVSAQLKELERQQIIEGKLVNKKDKIYFIKERFFNIWYLMRYGRKKNRQRVLWLIRFLEQWCEPEELKKRALLHMANIKKGQVNPKTAFYLTEALSGLLDDELDLQDKILETAGNYLSNCDNGLAKSLSQSNLSILKYKADGNDLIALNKIGVYYWQTKIDNQKALKYFFKVIEITKECDLKKLDKEFAKEIEIDVNIELFEEKYYELNEYIDACFFIGTIYGFEMEEYKEAIKLYEELLKMEAIKINQNRSMMLYSDLGDIYLNNVRKLDMALAYYKKAQKVGDKRAYIYERIALVNFLESIDRHEAIENIEKAFELEENLKRLELLALILLWNDRFEEAFEKIIRVLKLSNEENEIFEEMMFIMLLGKYQHHFALNLFNEFNDLKERMKPVYFALMKYMKGEYPKEYLKMGSEIQEVVNEIQEMVDLYSVEYN